MVRKKARKKKIVPKEGYKPKKKSGTYTIRKLKQTPNTRKSIKADYLLDAQLPGKRVTDWGTEYWETRENRSDKSGSRL